MAAANMPGTRMVTASVKFTSIPWKGSGRCCAPGYARTAAFPRRSCPSIWASFNSSTIPTSAAKPCSAPSLPPWSHDQTATTPQSRKSQQGLVNPHHGVVNIVDAETHYARVLDVRAYFAWRVELALHRIPVASGRYGDAAQKLGDWKAMIGAQVRGGKRGRKYGLPSELRARVLRILHPDSPA